MSNMPSLCLPSWTTAVSGVYRSNCEVYTVYSIKYILLCALFISPHIARITLRPLAPPLRIVLINLYHLWKCIYFNERWALLMLMIELIDECRHLISEPPVVGLSIGKLLLEFCGICWDSTAKFFRSDCCWSAVHHETALHSHWNAVWNSDSESIDWWRRLKQLNLDEYRT